MENEEPGWQAGLRYLSTSSSQSTTNLACEPCSQRPAQASESDDLNLIIESITHSVGQPHDLNWWSLHFLLCETGIFIAI